MSNAEIGTPAKRRSPLLRVLLWLVLSIVLIVAGVSGYAYYVAYSALPQLDGHPPEAIFEQPELPSTDRLGMLRVADNPLDSARVYFLAVAQV